MNSNEVNWLLQTIKDPEKQGASCRLSTSEEQSHII
jgi:hypothetical protein